jgi:tetratricopeptide (TPR) repeat protein
MLSSGERTALPVVGRWLLVLALALAIVAAWVNNPRGDGHYALGRAGSLLREGRYTQGMALLEETLKTYRGPQVRLALSYAYLARRDPVRAERQARLALSSASPPLRPHILAQLGRALRFAGREDEALAAWDEALAEAAPYMNMEDAREAARSSGWHKAILLWERGDWTSARAELEALAQDDDVYGRSARVKLAQLLAPGEGEASALLADEARRPGSTEGAIPNLRVPGLGEGIDAGEMERVLASLDRARLEVEQAEQSGAGEAAIDTLWGGAYLQMGENLLARDNLEHAVALEPDYAPAHARLALALFALGNSEAALGHVATAVELDADDPLPRHVLARIYTATGDWARAEEQLQALNRLEPGGVETHLEWAEFYRLQGEYDLAEGELIDAVNAQIAASALPGLIPGGTGESANAAMALARFYTDARGFGCEKGLPAARQAVSLRPDDPAGFDAVGWALVICGRPEDALSSLEEAVERSPDEPRYRYHLARAYSALGRRTEARDQYAWTSDLDPGGPWERLSFTDLVNMGSET